VLLLGQAVLRGLELDCGCFGAGAPAWLEQAPVALARAGLLLAATLWWWLTSAPYSRTPV
jgi:hypothetical protein